VFADVGASSGYYDAAMAVFLDSVAFYLNDIDRHCLNKKNLDKVIRHYSKIKGRPLEATNTFHYVIGTPTQTNLPNDTFDVIFSNATMHVIEHPDSILNDLYHNLKPQGFLYIRDEIVYNGEQRQCSSRKCGHNLLQYDHLIKLMSRNGFSLTGETHEFGHPIYKFSKLTRG
jgi:SAM-dependent methyltransferase